MKSDTKILIIEDDPDIGEMLQMMLQYKSFNVTLIEASEKAAGIMRNHAISLVIMDMLLSGTNGIDVCGDFKSDPTIAHIPVIMMSAHPDAKVGCLEAGADDFISKPFDLKDIIQKVDSLLKKALP
ncbi:MAG: response regulator [Gloeobacteraceae cyanobacterium ES-bin-316]|nr:response regulator [Ferruginibacter sp.]